MRRRRLRAWVMALVSAGGAAACGSARSTPTTIPGVVNELRVQIHEGRSSRVVTLQLDRYIEAAILSELTLGSADAPRAETIYALQAIVSRSYAVANRGRHAAEGFDLCDTTHCQLVRLDQRSRSEWMRAAAYRAVARTAGVTMRFHGQPVQALFHAACGGHTADARSIWGGDRPAYLSGVRDPYCATTPSRWRYEVSLESLGQALAAERSMDPGGPVRGVSIQQRDPSGVVTAITITGKRSVSVRGEELRRVLSASMGAQSIRSPKFDVEVTGKSIVFTGVGYGHGAGLCQAGALAQLRAGASPEDVLRFYFPGVDVTRVRR